jgi:superfamily II DNA or RNA helicase
MNQLNKFRSTNLITGDEGKFLSYWLKRSIAQAQRIDIIVSFVMESGINLLIKDLEEAIERGTKVNILTGRYLNITEPQALYKLRDRFGDKINLRFYDDESRSFHPKAYIFHYKDSGEVYIGSSNISRGALTNSIEWNYRFSKDVNENDFNSTIAKFEDLFNNHSIEVTDEILRNYSKKWIKPKVLKQIEEDRPEVISIIEPRGVQIEALYALNKTREEGFDKALVVASTGIGKTYLAAFDSKEFDRILFIAHREEIIKQAAESFRIVHPGKSAGLFYSAKKEADKDAVFAMVNTIGKDEYLNKDYFKKDSFDYIVIDEFHHAVADSYRRVLEYFKPRFLLGLTATPERLDNEDVFALCDYNVAYEIRLKEAINRGELVPFNYYGVYDETVNYDTIDYRNGRYDERLLEEALQINTRADLILKHYRKYSSARALGFCTSKMHAEHMSKYFNENGISSAAVYSGEQGQQTKNREVALSKLTEGSLKVIFSVDMFNEGVDVPSIDMVMFLRPTQSPTVFMQQLGRGLRKFKGKERLQVIDFIGNYKKANLIPFLLSGKPFNKSEIINRPVVEYDYPEDCHIDFDLKVIDIFRKMSEVEASRREQIEGEFRRVKDYLGHRPTRTELFIHMDEQIYGLARQQANLNPFRDYLKFLDELDELNPEEKKLRNSLGSEFIKVVETTSMSKSYKMPILLAFYNNGKTKIEIDDQDIYESFENFYSKPSNAVDMTKDNSTRGFRSWGKNQYVGLAKRNPVHFLTRTHGDFFYINEAGNMCINREMKDIIKLEEFIEHYKDAIDYRTMQYYRTRFENKEQ